MTSAGTDTADTGCEPGTLDCTCHADDTCNAGLVCASNRCTVDPLVTTSPVTSVSGGSGTDGTSTGSGSDGSTSVGPTECDPADGVENAACEEPSAPYCDPSGACVGCSSIACADVDAAAPLCDRESGRCVTCTAADTSACAGGTPICSDGACVPCTEHSQCGGGACNLASGECFGGDALWVDKGVAPSECAAADGSQNKPFCEIADALAVIPAATPTLVWVAPAAEAYAVQASIEAGRVVAIRSSGDGRPRLEVTDAEALVIGEGALALVDHLKIGYPATFRGALCLGGALWLDDSIVDHRKEIGVEGSGCELTLRRSLITSNLGGGIATSGGELHLENAFVVANGWASSAIGGLASEGGVIDLVYASVLGNEATGGVPASLVCSAETTGAITNSILLISGEGSSLGCDAIEVTQSAIDDPPTAAAERSNALIEGGLDGAWFVKPSSGDYHLKAGAMTPFEGLARWTTGQPPTDFDGQARPQVDGAPDFAGADVP
ncbi:MAG: hypothetical protein H6710_08665 [Myxococcales bacterium]|nr:hypothetical protein [Myxococcales bacterium]